MSENKNEIFYVKMVSKSKRTLKDLKIRESDIKSKLKYHKNQKKEYSENIKVYKSAEIETFNKLKFYMEKMEQYNKKLDSLPADKKETEDKLKFHTKKSKLYSNKLLKIQKIKKKTKKRKKLAEQVDSGITPITQELRFYTVKDLKNFCRQRKLYVYGLKNEIIDRLREFTLESSAELQSVSEKDRKTMKELGSI